MATSPSQIEMSDHYIAGPPDLTIFYTARCPPYKAERFAIATGKRTYLSADARTSLRRDPRTWSGSGTSPANFRRCRPTISKRCVGGRPTCGGEHRDMGRVLSTKHLGGGGATSTEKIPKSPKSSAQTQTITPSRWSIGSGHRPKLPACRPGGARRLGFNVEILDCRFARLWRWLFSIISFACTLHLSVFILTSNPV